MHAIDAYSEFVALSMPLGSSTVVLPRQSVECQPLYTLACGVTRSSEKVRGEMNVRLVAQFFDSQGITHVSGPQRLNSAHLSKAEYSRGRGYIQKHMEEDDLLLEAGIRQKWLYQ